MEMERIKLLQLATGEEFKDCKIKQAKEPTEDFYEVITADSKRYLVNINYVEYILID